MNTCINTFASVRLVKAVAHAMRHAQASEVIVSRFDLSPRQTNKNWAYGFGRKVGRR